MNEDNAPRIIPICLHQLLLCKLRCYFCFPFILAGTGIKHFVLSQQGKLPLSSRFRDHIFLVYLWRCYETRISRIFETCRLYLQVLTTANCLAPNKPDGAKWESSILYYPVLQQTASKTTGGGETQGIPQSFAEITCSRVGIATPTLTAFHLENNHISHQQGSCKIPCMCAKSVLLSKLI